MLREQMGLKERIMLELTQHERQRIMFDAKADLANQLSSEFPENIGVVYLENTAFAFRRRGTASVLRTSYARMNLPVFWENYEHWKSLCQRFEADIQIMDSSIGYYLHKTRDSQEYRDSLPEIVVGLIPELAKLERKNPPGYHLSENLLALAQMGDDTLTFYAMTGII